MLIVISPNDYIQKVPKDIWKMIFEFTDIFTVHNSLTKICKKFNEIIKTISHYHIKPLNINIKDDFRFFRYEWQDSYYEFDELYHKKCFRIYSDDVDAMEYFGLLNEMYKYVCVEKLDGGFLVEPDLRFRQSNYKNLKKAILHNYNFFVKDFKIVLQKKW